MVVGTKSQARNTIAPKPLQNKEQKLYSHHEKVPYFSLYIVLCYTSYTGLLSSFQLSIYLLFKQQYLRLVLFFSAVAM